MNTVHENTPFDQRMLNGNGTQCQDDAVKSLEEQYAYRAKLSAQDAISEVRGLLQRVDANLSSYFDTVAHRELMKSIAGRVSDAAMLALIKAWLEIAIEESDGKGNSWPKRLADPEQEQPLVGAKRPKLVKTMDGHAVDSLNIGIASPSFSGWSGGNSDRKSSSSKVVVLRNAMDNPSTTVSFPRVDRKRDCSVLNVLGASIQFLVSPQQDEDAPCILKRTIPPGISVPMHSHDVVEVFFVLSGNFEVLIGDGKMRWIEVSAGNLIEVPSNAKHAFRNRSQHPVINLVFTTSKHGRYLQEIGGPAASRESIRPPTLNEIQHFVKTAALYGYWLATPEENASVGIRVPQFTHQTFSGASAAA